MGQKFALLIGNSQYTDSHWAPLAAVENDITGLSAVLRDEAIGSFETITLVNEPFYVIQREISRFFADKKRDDMLLLYFSGHGHRDMQGRLYFIAKDTEFVLLSGTGIPASFVTGQMDDSNSRRQILILDCCNSGAFAEGTRSAPETSMGIKTAFEGSGFGRVVLTATDATQFGYEGDRIIGEGVKNGLYSHFLIEGLRTGAADANPIDGQITVNELHDYVFRQVVAQTSAQTPSRWSYKEQGDLVIARNLNPVVQSAPSPPQLPFDLQQDIQSMVTYRRRGAVSELERLLREGTPDVARLAQAALHQLQQDDSRSVSFAAEQALATREPPAAPETNLPTDSALPPTPSHERENRSRRLVPQLVLVAAVAVFAILAIYISAQSASPIIQTVVTLGAVYLVLSILVSQINTVMADTLNLRARQLHEGLSILVTDLELRAKLLAHPLIRLVMFIVRPDEQLSVQQAEMIITSRASKVNYISPSTLADALINILITEGDDQQRQLEQVVRRLPDDADKLRLRELVRRLTSAPEETLPMLREAVLHTPESADRVYLDSTIDAMEIAIDRYPGLQGDMFRLIAGVQETRNPEFRGTLEAILRSVRSLDEARVELAEWFNEGILQASEAYGRKMRMLSLLVGLIVGILINADTLFVLRTLWDAPPSRQTIVENVQRGLSAESTQETETSPQLSAAEIQITVQDLLETQRPFGWSLLPISEQHIIVSRLGGLSNPLENPSNLWNFAPGNNPTGWLSVIIQKQIGLIMTMIVVAQLAPAWFNLLHRIGGYISPSRTSQAA